jgi:hypothetical protein
MRPGGNYELRPLKRAELPDLIPVRPQNSEPAQALPRYVQPRKLASGVIAYYWCRPWWARGADCPLENEALGQHFDEVKARAAILNEQLDSWRLDRKSAKARPLAVTPKACPLDAEALGWLRLQKLPSLFEATRWALRGLGRMRSG